MLNIGRELQSFVDWGTENNVGTIAIYPKLKGPCLTQFLLASDILGAMLCPTFLAEI